MHQNQHSHQRLESRQRVQDLYACAVHSRSTTYIPYLIRQNKYWHLHLHLRGSCYMDRPHPQPHSDNREEIRQILFIFYFLYFRRLLAYIFNIIISNSHNQTILNESYLVQQPTLPDLLFPIQKHAISSIFYVWLFMLSQAYFV